MLIGKAKTCLRSGEEDSLRDCFWVCVETPTTNPEGWLSIKMKDVFDRTNLNTQGQTDA